MAYFGTDTELSVDRIGYICAYQETSGDGGIAI